MTRIPFDDNIEFVEASKSRHVNLPRDKFASPRPAPGARRIPIPLPESGNFIRARDARELGITPRNLEQLVQEGFLVRIARGLYRLADAEPTEHYTIAAVCALVPNAIVCLLSALSVHNIGTQLPREVWIAIAHKARAPRITEFPIKVIRFSGASLNYGVEEIQLEGVSTRVTNPARTVVDCFRFRRLVGSDVAREALREVLRERKASPDEIWRAAEVCRARSLVASFLEALTG